MTAKRVAFRKVAVAGLLLGLLATSALGAPSPQLVRLTFYYPVGVAGPLARVIDEMVSDFNRQTPDVEVVAVYSGDYDPTMQKVQTAVMAGNPPDIAVVEISEMPTLLAMDAIIPLDLYVRAEGSQWLRDFFPAFLQNSYSGGRFYAVPFQRSTPVLYWNKDAFKEVGLDPDTPSLTWDDLEAYAKRLVKRDPAGGVQRWGVTISGGWNDWLFEAFVRQNGGALLDYGRRQLRFDSPEAVEALRFWVRLTNELKVAPPHSTWSSTPLDFVAGRTAMLYHSTGILTFLKNSARFPFGVGFLPMKKQYAVEVGGGNFFVFKKIPKSHQDAAWRFIRWMTNPEQAARWSMASGYIAVRRSAYDVPAMKEFVAKHPEYLVAREQLRYGYGKIMAPNFQRLREILKRALDDATGGRVSPDVALRRAQQEAQQALAAWLRR